MSILARYEPWAWQCNRKRQLVLVFMYTLDHFTLANRPRRYWILQLSIPRSRVRGTLYQGKLVHPEGAYICTNRFVDSCLLFAKSLALWCSGFLIINWVLGCSFVPNPLNILDKIFNYGVCLFFWFISVLCPNTVSADCPRLKSSYTIHDNVWLATRSFQLLSNLPYHFNMELVSIHRDLRTPKRLLTNQLLASHSRSFYNIFLMLVDIAAFEKPPVWRTLIFAVIFADTITPVSPLWLAGKGILSVLSSGFARHVLEIIWELLAQLYKCHANDCPVWVKAESLSGDDWLDVILHSVRPHFVLIGDETNYFVQLMCPYCTSSSYVG